MCARSTLALAGLLIGVERHLASRRRFDGAHLASLAASPWLRQQGIGPHRAGLPAAARWRLTTTGFWAQMPAARPLRLLPALVLLAAHLAWRAACCWRQRGRGLRPPAPLSHLAPLELWRHLIGMAPIPREALGATLGPLLAATAALLALEVVSARARRPLPRPLVPRWFAAAVAAVRCRDFSGSPSTAKARACSISPASGWRWMVLVAGALGAALRRARRGRHAVGLRRRPGAGHGVPGARPPQPCAA